jgi:hypothetical protein
MQEMKRKHQRPCCFRRGGVLGGGEGNGAPEGAGIPNSRPALRPAAAFRRAIGGVLLPTAGRASPPALAPDCSAGSRQEAIVPPGGAPPSPESVAANHARRRRIPLRFRIASRSAPR